MYSILLLFVIFINKATHIQDINLREQELMISIKKNMRLQHKPSQSTIHLLRPDLHVAQDADNNVYKFPLIYS